MPRQIITPLAAGQIGKMSGSKPDDYLTIVAKLIPADVISVYLAVFNIIKQLVHSDTTQHTLQWIIFIGIGAILPFYLWRVAGVKDKKQIVLSAIAYLIWVLSLGGPFSQWGELKPETIGAIILPIYTLVVPILTYPVTAQNPPAPPSVQ